MDAIDKAFLKSLKNYPLARSMIPKYTILDFTPFDPVSKKVTAIVQTPSGERMTCVKGAPVFVMNTVREAGDALTTSITPSTPKLKNTLIEVIEPWALHASTTASHGKF